jgi:hypothetical protein
VKRAGPKISMAPIESAAETDRLLRLILDRR